MFLGDSSAFPNFFRVSYYLIFYGFTFTVERDDIVFSFVGKGGDDHYSAIEVVQVSY